MRGESRKGEEDSKTEQIFEEDGGRLPANDRFLRDLVQSLF